MGSFGNSFTAFVFPTGAYLWVYRTAAARANAPKQPLYVLCLCLHCLSGVCCTLLSSLFIFLLCAAHLSVRFSAVLMLA